MERARLEAVSTWQIVDFGISYWGAFCDGSEILRLLGGDGRETRMRMRDGTYSAHTATLHLRSALRNSVIQHVRLDMDQSPPYVYREAHSAPDMEKQRVGYCDLYCVDQAGHAVVSVPQKFEGLGFSGNCSRKNI